MVETPCPGLSSWPLIIWRIFGASSKGKQQTTWSCWPPSGVALPLGPSLSLSTCWRNAVLFHCSFYCSPVLFSPFCHLSTNRLKCSAGIQIQNYSQISILGEGSPCVQMWRLPFGALLTQVKSGPALPAFHKACQGNCAPSWLQWLPPQLLAIHVLWCWLLVWMAEMGSYINCIKKIK